MVEILFGLVVIFALYAIGSCLDDIRKELRSIRQHLEAAGLPGDDKATSG